MADYIKTMQEVSVPRVCANCLYCGSDGLRCGNANNRGLLMLLINHGRACSHFWLDQHKYPYAESRR